MLLSNLEARETWSWPYFTPAELECHCNQLPRTRRYPTCPTLVVNPEHMNLLVRIRQEFKKPMRITSAFRCPQHNAAVSSTGKNGPHTHWMKGFMAVDVGVFGEDAYDLIMVAQSVVVEGVRVTGIGVNQRGMPQSSRFIHLDTLPRGSAEHPRPWIWSY